MLQLLTPATAPSPPRSKKSESTFSLSRTHRDASFRFQRWWVFCPSRLVSSEELEMERIKNLQREVALHRMQNEASYKAALAGSE